MSRSYQSTRKCVLWLVRTARMRAVCLILGFVALCVGANCDYLMQYGLYRDCHAVPEEGLPHDKSAEFAIRNTYWISGGLRSEGDVSISGAKIFGTHVDAGTTAALSGGCDNFYAGVGMAIERLATVVKDFVTDGNLKPFTFPEHFSVIATSIVTDGDRAYVHVKLSEDIDPSKPHVHEGAEKDRTISSTCHVDKSGQLTPTFTDPENRVEAVEFANTLCYMVAVQFKGYMIDKFLRDAVIAKHRFELHTAGHIDVEAAHEQIFRINAVHDFAQGSGAFDCLAQRVMHHGVEDKLLCVMRGDGVDRVSWLRIVHDNKDVRPDAYGSVNRHYLRGGYLWAMMPLDRYDSAKCVCTHNGRDVYALAPIVPTDEMDSWFAKFADKILADPAWYSIVALAVMLLIVLCAYIIAMYLFNTTAVKLERAEEKIAEHEFARKIV
ncbi:gp38.2 [Caviid betaherpesvirus 2]|uniref:Gp38.2 n=1 Tax=Guinea pig cytomegalovirus (strain 22122) TaxID=103920 RepID=B7TPV9_GPCMV|nr:gp38.2 [Caviid betaherpesvirus 2]AGE11517.1 gp38.2 [Caviid betaherpesvirus 2]AIL83905.1 gp38.2 [BAC cloning vector GPN13BACdenovo_preserved(MM)]BAJ78507.1 gp38.2 [Caviid betaherpesvirus 2]